MGVARRGPRSVRNGVETSCRSHVHLGWSAKLDLSCSQSLDDTKGPPHRGQQQWELMLWAADAAVSVCGGTESSVAWHSGRS